MGYFDNISLAYDRLDYGNYFGSSSYSSYFDNYSYSSSYSSYKPLFNFNHSSYDSYAPSSKYSFNTASYDNYYAPKSSYSLDSNLPKWDYSLRTSSYGGYAPSTTYSSRRSNFGSVTRRNKVVHEDTAAANFVRTSGVSLNNIPANFREKNGVKEVTLPDGRKVLACRWSKFDNAQKEWLDTLKYFEQAAADLGCDLVYSDVERTVTESNRARAKKGSIVAPGGKSPHNYGVGTDFVLFKDGKAVDVNSDLQKRVVDRAIALSGNKIESGIYWKKKGERHHIELANWESKYKSSEYLLA